MIPYLEFSNLLPHLHQTKGKHWHVKLNWKDARMTMDQPVNGVPRDVTHYVLPA